MIKKREEGGGWGDGGLGKGRRSRGRGEGAEEGGSNLPSNTPMKPTEPNS